MAELLMCSHEPENCFARMHFPSLFFAWRRNGLVLMQISATQPNQTIFITKRNYNLAQNVNETRNKSAFSHPINVSLLTLLSASRPHSLCAAPLCAARRDLPIYLYPRIMCFNVKSARVFEFMPKYIESSRPNRRIGETEESKNMLALFAAHKRKYRTECIRP